MLYYQLERSGPDDGFLNDTVDGKNKPTLIGPLKGICKYNEDCFFIVR